MKTIIANNIQIQEPNTAIIEWVQKEMIVENPLYRQLKIMGKEDTIRFKHVPEKLKLFSMRGTTMTLPFGTLYAIWPLIKNDEVVSNFNKSKDISIKNDTPILEPYEYQEKAIEAMIKAKGGVLVSSCGSGKTFMGIEIIRRIGKRALWLCHTGDLLRQAKQDFEMQYPNIKIGLTTEGELNIGEDVTISTIQTLVNIDPELYKNEFEVVICDECAHVTSSPTQMKMFGTVLSNISARYKYGLTATPYRSDGMVKSMYAYIGCNTKGEFAPTYKIDSNETKKISAIHQRFEINSGYDEAKMYELYDASGMINYNNLINELSNNDERNNKICDNIIKLQKEGRKQVVLCSRVNQCEALVEKLKNKQILAELCVGKVSNKKRNEILNGLNWDVLVATYALLKEGISIKELDTLHMVTPIKDAATVVQCAGRIERYLPNKKTPIIFDYVDIDIPYCEKAYTARRRTLKKRF